MKILHKLFGAPPPPPTRRYVSDEESFAEDVEDLDKQGPAWDADARLMRATRALRLGLNSEDVAAIYGSEFAQQAAQRLMGDGPALGALLGSPVASGLPRLVGIVQQAEPGSESQQASSESQTFEERIAEYEQRADYAALATALSSKVERATDVQQQVDLLRRIAELWRERLNNAPMAARCLERAQSLAPEDRRVLVPLCELYIAAGRQSDAVPVLQRVIASYGGRRVKEVAGFHHMLARAFAGMGDNARALTELDAAYRVDLTNISVLRDLGLMAYEQGDYDRAQKTFRGLLLQRLDRDAPISKADVYYYLGAISRQQGDAQKAISMLERAVSEQASHERARTLLMSLKR